ncbi:MAG TPA: hypothetical protein VFD52_06260 [Clostridia bacterium]|nr:hypothetical protein [Clostridia bacterium]
MFAVLYVLERDKDWLAAFRERFKPAQPVIYSVGVKSGAPFFKVKVKETRNGIPWQSVKSICGRLSQKLLLTKDIQLPEKYDMDVFVPEVLPARLIFNCAAETLSRCAAKTSQLSVCIVDKKGVLSQFIDNIVMYATTIKIVTKDVCSYSIVASEIMDKFGATLIIDDNIKLAQDCTVVITTDISMLSGKEEGIIFAPSNTCEGSFKNVVSGEGVNMPTEYQELLPEGIEPLLFASALHELCGVDTLGNCYFQKLMIDLTPSNTYDVAKLISKVVK